MFSTLSKLGLSSGGDGPTSWVFALPLDRAFFDGRRERTISTQQGREILENFRQANSYFEAASPEGSTPYRFPVKENHRETGERYGDLLEAKIAGDGDEYGIYVKARWNADTWQRIQAGTHRHVSVGIEPEYQLESGETIGPVLTEISLTTVPRLQSIGTIQDTLEVTLSRIDSLNLGEHQMEELEELLTQVIENQRAILEHLADDVEASRDDDDEEEEVEASEAVEASTEDGESETDEPESETQEADEPNSESTPAIAVDTTELAEEVTERVEASLVEMVDDRIRTMVDNSRGLHLSEVGSEDQPQRGEKDFDTRLNELVSAGKSKREALRIMADEGY